MAVDPSHMILVVEDQPVSAEHTCEVLRQTGYKPTWAASLTEAMAAPDVEYEAIFLDLLLPETTHKTLTKAVDWMRARFPDTPLIVLSGYLPETNVMDLLRRGADFCLHKPLTVEAVRRIINCAVQINHGELSPTLERLEAAMG